MFFVFSKDNANLANASFFIVAKVLQWFFVQLTEIFRLDLHQPFYFSVDWKAIHFLA